MDTTSFPDAVRLAIPQAVSACLDVTGAQLAGIQIAIDDYAVVGDADGWVTLTLELEQTLEEIDCGIDDERNPVNFDTTTGVIVLLEDCKDHPNPLVRALWEAGEGRVAALGADADGPVVIEFPDTLPV